MREPNYLVLYDVNTDIRWSNFSNFYDNFLCPCFIPEKIFCDTANIDFFKICVNFDLYVHSDTLPSAACDTYQITKLGRVEMNPM